MILYYKILYRYKIRYEIDEFIYATVYWYYSLSHISFTLIFTRWHSVFGTSFDGIPRYQRKKLK